MGLFGRKKRQPEPTPQLMRDTLFGDKPLDQWPPEAAAAEAEPWASFVKARAAIERNNQAEAIQLWQQIAAMPDLEARHYLQAWHFLRQNGVQPPDDQAKTVYGVVVEVSMPKGLDLLAAYQDGSARYYNFSGAAVIWEHPNDSLDEAINALLAAGRAVVDMIGLWEGARPPAPTGGAARLNMLTPGGLYFGQGPMHMLSADPKGKLLLGTATSLMTKMTQLPNQKR